ncbi:MAG TPA: DUF4347 domain-containing protein, partial [Nitrosomonas mobilis]|nr:DUF4347 domain-containing protein [Nitrosomonas mobilis]
MIQHVQAEIKTKKLLFVDSDVADVESLLFGLESGYTVIPLCNDSYPITQLSTAIALHAPVDEMVIVAHAEPGRIIFAGQSIDVIALEQHGQELADWRSDLTEDARISIYACQLAAGEIGRDFLQSLGCLTGAKVASSTLPIGNLGAYRNWHLDHYTHAFDAPLPFHEKAMAAYQHTLAPVISIDRIASVLSVIEGASGSRQMEFVVTLSE